MIQLPPGGLLIGLGADLVDVERIRGVVDRQGDRFLQRVFTEEERTYCFGMKIPFPHLAARFAAKEAVSKAFTTGIGAELGWKSISVTPDWSRLSIDATWVSGWVNWREYWMNACTSPSDIVPLATRRPPSTAMTT